MEICKQQSEIEMRHLPMVDRFKCYGVRVGVAKFFFGPIDNFFDR